MCIRDRLVAIGFGFATEMMFVVGGMFALLWVVCFVLGRRIETTPGAVSYTHLDVYKRQGQRRIAPDAVEVLHPALGGQTVVVPTHGVEDLSLIHI